MYKVSEFAKLFHTSSSLLRYYDKEGIFSPEYRSPDTGYRYYTARQIYNFSTLMSARDMGLPLNELKNYKDVTAFYEGAFVQMKRRHDHFQLFLHDLEALRKPREHRIFAYTYPSFFAVQRGYTVDPEYPSWQILNQAALDLIHENIPVEYAHASHLVFHDSSYPHTSKKVSCCLSVKPVDHPWVEEVAERRYICIYHHGSRSEVKTAYRLLHDYIKQRNLSIDGFPSERYIRKTAAPESEEDVLLVIRFPLRSQW